MEQALLYVAGDFALDVKEKRQLLSEIPLLDLSDIADAWEKRKHLFAFWPEETTSSIRLSGKEDNEDIHFEFNGVQIRVSRNILTFRFPVLFRIWVEYEDFRLEIHHFLARFLTPFQSQNLLFYPSHWTQPEASIKNKWHGRRLAEAQQKIRCAENSYKRCRQHLNYCMGEARKRFVMEDYPGFFELPFREIDSGPLVLLAHCHITKDLLSFAEKAERETCFHCQAELRTNNCAFQTYRNDRSGNLQWCRLTHYFDAQKHTDFIHSVQEEKRVEWNRHCFFSLSLQNDYVEIRFRKSGAELLGKRRRQLYRLLQEMREYFPFSEYLFASAYPYAMIPKEADNYQKRRNFLLETSVTYSRAEEIPSWNNGILLLKDLSAIYQ